MTPDIPIRISKWVAGIGGAFLLAIFFSWDDPRSGNALFQLIVISAVVLALAWGPFLVSRQNASDKDTEARALLDAEEPPQHGGQRFAIALMAALVVFILLNLTRGEQGDETAHALSAAVIFTMVFLFPGKTQHPRAIERYQARQEHGERLKAEEFVKFSRHEGDFSDFAFDERIDRERLDAARADPDAFVSLMLEGSPKFRFEVWEEKRALLAANPQESVETEPELSPEEKIAIEGEEKRRLRRALDQEEAKELGEVARYREEMRDAWRIVHGEPENPEERAREEAWVQQKTNARLRQV